MGFTVLPGLNNDGLSDFATSMNSATTTAGADVSGLFSGEVVEVQPAATPEPSSLLLLGTGLTVCAGLLGRKALFKATRQSS